MTSDPKDQVPEWAWSKADQLAGVGWGNHGQGIRETFVREIARALVAAERRGIERAASGVKRRIPRTRGIAAQRALYDAVDAIRQLGASE